MDVSDGASLIRPTSVLAATWPFTIEAVQLLLPGVHVLPVPGGSRIQGVGILGALAGVLLQAVLALFLVLLFLLAFLACIVVLQKIRCLHGGLLDLSCFRRKLAVFLPFAPAC